LHAPLEGAFLSRTPNLLGGKGIHSRFEKLPCSRRSINPRSHHDALLYLSRSYSQESKGEQRSAKGSQAAAKVRNQQIITLGRDRDWKGILALYHEQSKDFNNVNFATTMSQLGRIQSVNKRDPSFAKFVDDLANIIEARGLEWMGIRSVANIVHVVGKMQLKSKSAQQIIDFAARKENAQAIVLRGEPQSVANICWAMAKLGRSDIFPSFMGILEGQSQWFVGEEGTPQEVANTAWACATLGIKSPNLFSEIETHSSWLVMEGDPQAVANIAWACATLGIQSPKLFSEIEQHSSWMVKEGIPQNVANIAWACATLGIQSPNLFSEIEQHSSWIVTEGIPQAVANTAWACATFGIQSPNLFSEIEQHSSWIVKEGIPQAVANTAWACATLGIQSPKLFSEIEQHSSWVVKEGNPQEVANTAWACATLGIQSPNLFSEIEQHSSWVVNEGNPQNVANTAWACATLGIQSPKLFSEIEQHSSWVVKEGNPQAVANTAWACATLGIQSPNLFSEIEKQSSWIVKEGNPQAVANIAWACSKFGFQSPKLFLNIEKQSSWLIKEAEKSGNMQHVSSVALSFAIVGLASEVIFGSLWKIVPNLIEEGNAQAIINICYAFAVLDLANEYEKEFRLLWAKAISFDPKLLPREARRQLLQTRAFVTASGVKSLQAPALLETGGMTLETDVHESRSQNEVSGILDDLGFHHLAEVSPVTKENTFPLPGGMLAIDMACRKQMIAIEFDGPFHFLREVGSGKVLEVENVATRAKRRFLERLGWKVANIRYFDWAKAKSKKAKRAFVSEMLKEV
jgi:hypothetical protein